MRYERSDHSASSSRSPVRMRRALSTVVMKILPSPMRPVWAAWAIAAAWLVFGGLFLWVGFHADDPGVPMVMLLLLAAGAVLGLLMVVMRALLRQATTLRTDLEGVI